MSNGLEEEFERYAGIHKLNAFFGIEIDMEVEISGAVRSISTSIDLIQKIIQLAQKTKNAELCEAIADLRVELSQAKIAIANANDRIVELMAENQQLKEKLYPREEPLILGNDGLYYTEEGDGGFCPNCYVSEGLRIKLTQAGLGTAFGGVGLSTQKCPHCLNLYK